MGERNKGEKIILLRRENLLGLWTLDQGVNRSFKSGRKIEFVTIFSFKLVKTFESEPYLTSGIDRPSTEAVSERRARFPLVLFPDRSF